MSEPKVGEKYNPAEIENKWTTRWEEEQAYTTPERSDKPKSYVLGMFPYASGAGLHTGHVRIYTAVDVISRYLRMNGYDVLMPMGWDSFGLPAENAAIKARKNPIDMVPHNEANFKRQMMMLGLSYDWGREFSTTDPAYYKWTQWLFLKLYSIKNDKGERLVYRKEVPINWCPFCLTGLANEEVQVDGTHERCGTAVTQKLLPQWCMRITDYADRLLADLDTVGLDWPEGILAMQKNWIGKKDGVRVKFGLTIPGVPEVKELPIFTTRIDTIFGATFVVAAPEKVNEWMAMGFPGNEEVKKYVEEALIKTEEERATSDKEKTGVVTGLMAVNPLTNEELPVYVADYVMGNVGTGAVMGVPAHDQRDFDFAIRYGLTIKPVILPQREYVDENAKPYYERRTNLHRELLRKLAALANKEGIFVGLQGGWALSVLLGKEYREYDDVDLFVDKNDLPWWKELLRAEGLSISNMFPEGKNADFYFQATKQDLHLDIEAIENRGGEVYLLGSTEPIRLGAADKVFEVRDWNGVKISALKSGLIYDAKKKKQSSGGELRWKEKSDFVMIGKEAFVEDGVLYNSGKYTGMKSEEARQQILEELLSIGIGERSATYHLRDWVFSRQRYWGEPFPLVYCPKCGDENGVVPLPPDQLPLTLPYLESYEPTETGQSPLSRISDWVETTCPNCGGLARRETDTMPNWAGSCWYFFRFADPHNDKEVWSQQAMKEWMPVDWYLGGAEHAVLHLLYARFWTKAFSDLGLINFSEPFLRLRSVGMVLASDGKKMSKSLGNVINPDDVVTKYGADAVRIYEMFMGPWDQAISWSERSLIGCRRFVEKIWDLLQNDFENKWKDSDSKLAGELNKVIIKVGEDIKQLKFNTAVAALMKFANSWSDAKTGLSTEDLNTLLLVMAPLAPFMTEELWRQLGNTGSIHKMTWPEAKMVVDEEVTMVIQVDGKTRDLLGIKYQVASSKEEVEKIALADEKVKKWVEGRKYEVIFVPGRLINFVLAE